MHTGIRNRIYEVIEPARADDLRSKIFDQVIISLIIINICAIVLESFPGIARRYSAVLDMIELVSIVVFTLEYALRLFTVSAKYPGIPVLKAVFLYVISPMALIDLAAILPFYLPFIIALDLRFLRILRLTRLLRVLKINRYSTSLQLLARVLRRTREKLLVTIFVTFILMLLSATIMYYLETDDQPQSFPNIIASFWWAVATLTTVGYGDVYPVTALGKTLAGVMALLGVGLVALPTGIISSGFIEEYETEKQRQCRAFRLSRSLQTNRMHRLTVYKKKRRRNKKL